MKILAYMDFLSPSGFGNVAVNVIDRLIPWLERKGYTLEICATNFGERDELEYHPRVKAFNAKMFARNMNDRWYRDGFLKMLQSKNYDLVWIMNDLPLITPMGPLLDMIQKNRVKAGIPKFKLVVYTPIDSPPAPSWFAWSNALYDELVTYTSYAYNEIRPYFHGQLSVIGHGFDKHHFYPSREHQKKYREKYNLPTDKFVFGTANKNHGRKDIGGTLLAYREFKKLRKDSNTCLYLHTHFQDPTGIKIHDLCERIGLKPNEDYYLPVEPKYSNAEYTLSDMNEMYNCMDAFVTTTMAEGWGLTITEAMCVGLPIVCGLHTSIKEITRNGEFVYGIDKFTEHIQIFDGEGIRYKLDPKDVAAEMACLYDYHSQHSDELIDYSEIAKEYDWDKIAQSWINIFNKHLK